MGRSVALFHLLRSHSKHLSTPRFQAGLHTHRSFGAWEAFSTVRPPLPNKYEHMNFNRLGTQKRWASQAARERNEENDSKISIGPRRTADINEDGKDTGIVYYGPISSNIKKTKLLSLSTCCLSVCLGLVITFMPDMNVILKGAVASSVIFISASIPAALHWFVIFLSVSTTAAHHWFVSPYVHKLKWQPGSDSFEVEMLSWLATHIPKTIRFSDIRPPETNRPFVTFKANDSFYFIDSEHCQNKALLARLTPQKKPAHESAFKNL